MLLALLLACSRPEIVNAEITFVSPDPDTEACMGDLPVEAEVTATLDHDADVVILAFFDELDWGEMAVLAAGRHPANEEESATFGGTLAWDGILDDADRRLVLVADLGQFPTLDAGDELDVEEDYLEDVSAGDIYARASVTVWTCE